MIELFNNYFKEQADVNLITEFTSVDSSYKGKIDIRVSENVLVFDVEIPCNFPFSENGFCIRFRNPKLYDVPHYACIHTASSLDPHQKLELELYGLRSWIKDYVIDKKKDKHYDYLPVPYKPIEGKQLIQKYFFQDTNVKFTKNSYGKFTFSSFGYENFFITEFLNAGNQCLAKMFWNTTLNSLDKQNVGFWFFIQDEPVVKPRVVANKWSELSKYFSHNLKEYLYRIYETQNNKAKHNREYTFPILLGYEISDNVTKSIQWEAAHVNLKDFFVKIDNSVSRVLNYKFTDSEIFWQQTLNSSYDRFFGRGKLPDEISTKKILVIGTGAIGSQVTKILVKGGVRDLTICDIDIVEQGNLCRAEFSIQHIGFRKSDTLKWHLSSLSPFVNITIEKIAKYPATTKEFEQVKNLLNQYELIFDCTTDNEMALMLDTMKLKAKIFNLSITNHAKEMLCITGSNIMEFKSHVAASLDNTVPNFYEGMGCQYPTFEAGYLDISAHLAYAMKMITKFLKSGIKPQSFIVKDNFDKNLSTTSHLIKTYTQKELNLKLVISEGLLDDIKKLSIESIPKETGGIFIGRFFDDNYTIYISEILSPKKTVNTEISFTRHVEDLNKYIEKRFKESKGEFTYVGEWHSHPNGSPEYSGKDFDAMTKIAQDVQIQTNNPILLINGFSTKSSQITFYVFKNNKLYEYEED